VPASPECDAASDTSCCRWPRCMSLRRPAGAASQTSRKRWPTSLLEAAEHMSAHYLFRFALDQFGGVREHQIRMHSSESALADDRTEALHLRRLGGPGNGMGLAIVYLQPFGT